MMTTETVTELAEVIRMIDTGFDRPPKTPSASSYRKGYQDALLDLRWRVSVQLKEGIAPTLPLSEQFFHNEKSIISSGST